MDLENIRLLEQVIKLGSVQRAASQLGIPRSTLRRKLEVLAEEVGGGELVVATAAGVTLTAAGMVVLEQGRALVEGYARMVSSARAPSTGATGRIRCIAPLGMPEVARVALIQTLHSIAPGLCFEEVEYADPLEHLDEPFDLMFHFGEPPARDTWFSRVLRRMRLVPLASEAYLVEKGRPRTLADLAEHRLIGWCIGRSNPRAWPLADGKVLAVEPSFVSSNANVVHRAAQQGLGIVLGNPDPHMLPLATPLIPVLDDQIGDEVAFRCLSPFPTDRDPRTRSVLEGIHRFLAHVPGG